MSSIFKRFWRSDKDGKNEAEKRSLCDEHLLQYTRPGESGECELIVGLDFGTSASKVVIQAPTLPGPPRYVVDFGDFSHQSAEYLLATRLSVTSDGTCYLTEQQDARVVNDIKLELFARNEGLQSNRGPSRQGLDTEATAVAYLALLLRHARKWFLETKRDVVGHFNRLRWSINLGVPSPCIEDNEENRRFGRVGKAAWMLSVLEEVITLEKAQDQLRSLIADPESWDRADERLTCDFEIIPEIAAGAVGYALSDLRREGLHVMVDVGAATVDVCSFVLHRREGSDSYSLLMSDVKQFGTIRLHNERIRALKRVYEKQAEDLRDKHDPLVPIAEDVEAYLVSREQLISAVKKAEADLKMRCQEMLKRVIWETKKSRDPNSSVWRGGRLPILLIGGGSKLPFFRSAVEELDAWLKSHTGNDGILLMPDEPLPKGFTSKTAKYDRIAVALGLSHPASDIGEIIPADRIADIEPRARRNWDDRYVSMDQV